MYQYFWNKATETPLNLFPSLGQLFVVIKDFLLLEHIILKKPITAGKLQSYGFSVLIRNCNISKPVLWSLLNAFLSHLFFFNTLYMKTRSAVQLTEFIQSEWNAVFFSSSIISIKCGSTVRIFSTRSACPYSIQKCKIFRPVNCSIYSIRLRSSIVFKIIKHFSLSKFYRQNYFYEVQVQIRKYEFYMDLEAIFIALL